MLKWRNYSKTDWENARYCQECGLPTLKTAGGEYYCAHCNEIEKWRRFTTQLQGENLREVEKHRTETKYLNELIDKINQNNKTQNQNTPTKTEWKNPKLNEPVLEKEYLVKSMDWHGTVIVYIDRYMGFGAWQGTSNVDGYKEIE